MSQDLQRRIIDFWLAIEYLQPGNAPKESPKDRIWNITGENLYPWEDPAKLALQPSIAKRVWRSKVYVGLIDMEATLEDLRKALGVEAEEEFRAPASAAMISMEVDAQGFVASDISVGSLVWAMGQICHNPSAALNPDQFDAFAAEAGRIARESLVERATLSPGFAARCELDPEVVCCRPIAHSDILAIMARVADLAGYHPIYSVPARVSTRATAPGSGSEDSDDDLINSLVAQDLALVRSAIDRRDIGRAFESYLHGTKEVLQDVVIDRVAAFSMVEPSKVPLGRWASEYPLAFAQQASVNAIFERLEVNGIFSVNGPPGTGKTTLLRDIVANIVVKRADFLASLSSPDDAFSRKIDIPGEKYGYWDVQPQLAEFGIVVASANNAAVENVSRELPGSSAISDAFKPVDYFSDVADTLAAPKPNKDEPLTRKANACWGLISAVLGNKGNRADFANRFWFTKLPEDRTLRADDPVSIRMALQFAVEGVPSWKAAKQAYAVARERAKSMVLRTSILLDALRRYDKTQVERLANQALLPALELALLRADGILAEASASLPPLQAEVDQLCAYLGALERRDEIQGELQKHLDSRPEPTEAVLRMAISDGDRAMARAQRNYDAAQKERDVHLQMKPGFLTNLISLGRAERDWAHLQNGLNQGVREVKVALDKAEDDLAHLQQQLVARKAWQEEQDTLQAELGSAVQALEPLGLSMDLPIGSVRAKLKECQNGIATCSGIIRKAEAERAQALARHVAVEAELQELERQASEADTLITENGSSLEALGEWRKFHSKENDLQPWAPWEDRETLDARARLFIAALALHKVFLVHGRRRFETNMSRFVDLVQGKLSPHSLCDGGAALWSTFFLAIPLVSTTFASFGRLFSGLGRESLGWVLVDEAGQATPQLAVGAIWRARRAVIVGDPLQVEPVMTVPKTAVSALGKAWRVGPKWDPSITSVQILADEANPLGTWLCNAGSAANDGALDEAQAETRIWVGSPLRVHRRCLNPMFRIANRIAYNGLMVYGTGGQDNDPWLGESCWVDVPATNHDGHWVAGQGTIMIQSLDAVIALKGDLLARDGKASVYVISPFRKVADEARKLIANRFDWKIARSICGTVHTFQGKEADVVILLLGGDPTKPGSITSYAGRSPNLLNVAVTRAKKRLYMIGDHNHWARHHFYDELSRSTPRITMEQFIIRLKAGPPPNGEK